MPCLGTMTDLAPVATNMSQGHVPEARVLVIMTGGTICMQKSQNGLVPARKFLERCMAPRPEFNDGEMHDPITVRFHDGPEGLGELQSLRTPTSVYGKRVRYVVDTPLDRYAVLEFETLLDSSSIDSQGWAEIAQTIFRNYKFFDGFVVLHGTDSLAYTGRLDMGDCALY